jgi:hypothetical protein
MSRYTPHPDAKASSTGIFDEGDGNSEIHSLEEHVPIALPTRKKNGG